MTIELLTPAKINLGLEVLRKRGDDYHDIATVFQTISVFDRIRITPAKNDELQIINRFVQIEANLAARALDLAKQSGLSHAGHRIEIEKRIPIAAGLGGASADAAAVLLGLDLDQAFSGPEVAALALQLGSDVPFLLQGGAAHATGRGELLESCASLRSCWIVLASPDIEIERKTARLYGALRPGDFSDGSATRRVASALERGTIPDPADLGNAFTRPLQELMPESSRLVDHFRAAGAPFVALTGAGPTHYTIVPALSNAISMSARLARQPPVPMRVLVARPVPSGARLRRRKTHMTGSAL